METGSGRVPGRTRLRTPWPYRVMNIVFALLFLGVVVLAILMNQNTAAGFSWYWLLAAAAGGAGVAFLLSRLFALFPAPSKTVEIMIVLVLFSAYAVVQVLAGWGLRVQPETIQGFGEVHQAAAAYAQTGALPGEYFAQHPGDAGLYFLLACYYSALTLFGVTDLAVAGFVLNVVAIDAALVLLYFCGRRLFGARQAILLLVCAFLTLPFLMHTPIWYTDTLALVFPIATVLLWMQTRALWRKGEVGRAIGRFCVLSLVAGLGTVLNILVAIVWLAVVIDLLVLLAGKGRWKLLLAGLAVMLVVAVGGRFAVRNTGMLPQYDTQRDGVPFTAGAMMGLAGDGAYNDADFEAILAVEGSARGAYIAGEIGERLQDKGFLGVLEQLGRKLGATFGDGTYGAGDKLGQGAVQPCGLQGWFAAGGGYYTLLAYLAFAAEMALLVWMTVAALKALVRQNHALTFMRVALFGLLLFLALWETQPRYLVPLLPLCLLCAVEAAPPPGFGRAARRQARLAHIRAVRPLAAQAPPAEDDLDAVPLGTESFPAITGDMTSTQRFLLPQEPATLFDEPAEPPLQQTQPIGPLPGDVTGDMAVEAGWVDAVLERGGELPLPEEALWAMPVGVLEPKPSGDTLPLPEEEHWGLAAPQENNLFMPEGAESAGWAEAMPARQEVHSDAE